MLDFILPCEFISCGLITMLFMFYFDWYEMRMHSAHDMKLMSSLLREENILPSKM